MRYPLMPTGVEHNTALKLAGIAALMRYPLMPTGVEHLYSVPRTRWVPRNALPSDAYGR